MLKFPLRTEYALRALMELAGRRDDGPISAREIAQRQRIPMRFLEHQLSALQKADIVTSHRGAHGGYELARDAAAIRIQEVIDVIEGPIAPMYCLDPHEDEQCSESHQCGLQELWVRVEGAVRNVFENTTVSELARRHGQLQPLLWPVSIDRARTD